MNWQLYVLVSHDRKRTYVGITLDLERRLAQHQGQAAGGAKSTRAGRPWSVAAQHGPYPDRASAQRAERELKRLCGRARCAWRPPAELPGAVETASEAANHAHRPQGDWETGARPQPS